MTGTSPLAWRPALPHPPAPLLTPQVNGFLQQERHTCHRGSLWNHCPSPGDPAVPPADSGMQSHRDLSCSSPHWGPGCLCPGPQAARLERCSGIREHWCPVSLLWSLGDGITLAGGPHSPVLSHCCHPGAEAVPWTGTAVSVPVTAGSPSLHTELCAPGKANAAQPHDLTRSKLASCDLQLL